MIYDIKKYVLCIIIIIYNIIINVFIALLCMPKQLIIYHILYHIFQYLIK